VRPVTTLHTQRRCLILDDSAGYDPWLCTSAFRAMKKYMQHKAYAPGARIVVMMLIELGAGTKRVHRQCRRLPMAIHTRVGASVGFSMLRLY